MLLAGDIGGTKTLLGLFEPAEERPRSLVVREYATLDFDSLEELIQVFLDDTRAESQLRGFCLGVAGPVSGLVARLTNVPWLADASVFAERWPDCPVRLLNDLGRWPTPSPSSSQTNWPCCRPGCRSHPAMPR
jgi:glucokinase